MNAATLLDGDPLNNYLKRARPTFNPDGALNDANNITIAGNYAYITTAQGARDRQYQRSVKSANRKPDRSQTSEVRWRFSFGMHLWLMMKD